MLSVPPLLSHLVSAELILSNKRVSLRTFASEFEHHSSPVDRPLIDWVHVYKPAMTPSLASYILLTVIFEKQFSGS